MTEKKVKIVDNDKASYGKWVDTVVVNDIPIAILVMDDGSVMGSFLEMMTVLP